MLVKSNHQGEPESVWNCYYTTPTAGLPDMTTLHSCLCEKMLLDVV